jgi:hypothetical protein
MSGNGTVFEGNLVETAAARSVIQLAGSQMTLAPDSSARVYRDRIVLVKGSGSVKDSAHQVIEAATMRIVPSTQDSVVQIAIASPSRITVLARGGAAEVSNSSGVLTARLRPGMALAFNLQAAGDVSVKMTGVIQSSGGLYFVTDETTQVTVQVLGSSEVSKYVGKRVEITGSSIFVANPPAGASQLIRAITISPAANPIEAGAAAAGRGAGGGGATGGASAAGFSAVTIGAIIGGVAIVGTVGGLAAAGTFGSDSSVSRP